MEIDQIFWIDFDGEIGEIGEIGETGSFHVVFMMFSRGRSAGRASSPGRLWWRRHGAACRRGLGATFGAAQGHRFTAPWHLRAPNGGAQELQKMMLVKL